MQHEATILNSPADDGRYHFMRRLLIAVIAILTSASGGLVIYSFVGREHWSQLWNMASHGLVASVLLILAVAQVRSISGIRALVGREVGRNLLLFVPLVLLVYLVCESLGIALGFPREDFMVNLFSGMSLPEQILCTLLIVTLPPISEELLYRHFLIRLFPLNHRIWKWVAVIVTAGIFTLVHSQYSNWTTFLLLASLGVLLALARIRTGGLAVPILMHSSAGVFGLSLDWVVTHWV